MTALLPQDIVGILFRLNKLVQMGMYNFRHTTSLGTQNCTFTQIVLGLRYILDQERTLLQQSAICYQDFCKTGYITPILGNANILHGWWLHKGPHKTMEMSKLGGGYFHDTCMVLA